MGDLGGELYLLQARPMTALPEPVEWEPPRAGLLDAQLPAGGVAARGDDPACSPTGCSR